MVTIFIDNQPYDADGSVSLLQAGLSLGFNIPYFCWHPALGSVGACRQCAVKQFRDEKDTRGKIVMSCMTPVTEGMRISIDDPEVIEFRRSVIEWLMTNHPHDCPVCDEGGHCHLQDMTVMTGHVYRRSRIKKRTYRNQDLGPFVAHEMNRCIQCYRCVRYYRDAAGGRDLNVFASHNNVYFGRAEDGTLESPFSGNLVEICPTGVFTDKTLARHYTRKWDLQMAPSVCVHCGVGCNTTPGERYGKLRRIENRYNGEVNRYYLCDRGRYGYEFVNHALRLRQPLVRVGGTGGSPVIRDAKQEPLTREAALERAAALLGGAKGAIGIGSPRASLEANYALRALVGPERFYAGIESREQRLLETALDLLRRGPARSPSLAELGGADAVLILGEDLVNTAPLTALAVRQAVRNQPLEAVRKLKIPEWLDASARNVIQKDHGPCFIATPAATGLDDVATRAWHAAPDEIARLGLAVAHALMPEAPGVADLSEDTAQLAAEIAEALKSAQRPAVIAGPSLGNEAILQAAAAVAWALCAAGKPAGLSFTAPECNSVGLALLGGRPLDDAFIAANTGRVDTVIVLENDLYRRADPAAVDGLLGGAARVIVLDHLLNETAAQAEIVLPAAAFAEADGTFVNAEGRAQRHYRVFTPEGGIQESWRWLAELYAETRRGEVALWTNFDSLLGEMANAVPALAETALIAPPAGYRIDGEKIARMPARYSGRTAMQANVSVHEPKPPVDPDSPFAFSMEGYQGPAPAPLVAYFWAPGWNSSMQALNKFQEEVDGPLLGGDPGRRLIEARTGSRPAWPAPKLERFASQPGGWWIVPLYHIFGSEELSVFSPGVRQLTPEFYIGLGEADLAQLGLQEGERVRISGGGWEFSAPVRLVVGLARGLAGVPRGLPGQKGPGTAGWCRIER